YWIFRAVGILALARLGRAMYGFLRTGREDLRFTLPAFWTIPLPLFILFVLAIAYQGWQIFNTQGASTAVGWYLSSVANAEVAVLVAGLGYAFGTRHAPRMAGLAAILCGALDLFTTNGMSLPYYAGIGVPDPRFMIAWSANSWPAGGVMEIFHRLSANHPAWLSSGVLELLWLLYLIATVLLLSLAVRLVLRPPAVRPEKAEPDAVCAAVIAP
ncbi:MAG: hypothetical protein LC114_26180, partial [Bryobacterales bacterium]|nr:hypothetical protein [Bryobacterales bacterium]